ncbi:hypothetical protein AYR62_11110 [Secundilactobacillus paracollinoides]|uniref:Uncharacterized protein n=1 Tax=Secundilactobacillus paracollinoides TaxID=240427 RepID=A0A1B2IY34_9LACO|nr:hypothetical protein [Secundilactobacillus paracollinoides]ANZ64580.1 hypothetical protein AYR62_11110 [Secundilactobacillus paracollinoides]ANZ66918.1 hypothetical protein AYR63_07095 [Secundilactobacillus paracollinoides]KRL76968.1 hypothetical protein FC17_GL001422 [Secundilactobacillus paracollinoides DSM 15502 = JCM 11969]
MTEYVHYNGYDGEQIDHLYHTFKDLVDAPINDTDGQDQINALLSLYIENRQIIRRTTKDYGKQFIAVMNGAIEKTTTILMQLQATGLSEAETQALLDLVLGWYSDSRFCRS